VQQRPPLPFSSGAHNKMFDSNSVGGSRQYDAGDFTSEHDLMFAALLEGWWLYVWHSLEHALGPDATGDIQGNIEGEPCLDGHPLLFPDAIATGTCDGRPFKFVFEIKPHIRSCGEVLRQLQLYKKRATPTAVVLLTHDKRYDSLFRGQGIVVLDALVRSGWEEDNATFVDFGTVAHRHAGETTKGEIEAVIAKRWNEGIASKGDVRIRVIADRVLAFLAAQPERQTMMAIKVAVPSRDKIIAPALALLEREGKVNKQAGPRNAQLWTATESAATEGLPF